MAIVIPCSDCDFIGPAETPREQWQRETHRAWHAFVAAAMNGLVHPWADRLVLALSRKFR